MYRRAITLVEVLVAAALLLLVLAAVYGLLSFTELREGMMVVAPPPGTSLPDALVKDNVARITWYYLTANGAQQELWRYTNDPALDPQNRAERLLSGIRRLMFTSRSEGALEINLVRGEGDQELALLTPVRLQNIAAADKIW